jgi:hypothetical protein
VSRGETTCGDQGQDGLEGRAHLRRFAEDIEQSPEDQRTRSRFAEDNRAIILAGRRSLRPPRRRPTLKPAATFGELDGRLKVVGSDLVHGRMVVFPDDVGKYLDAHGKPYVPEEFPIATAVRISAGYPGFFPPISLRYAGTGKGRRARGRRGDVRLTGVPVRPATARPSNLGVPALRWLLDWGTPPTTRSTGSCGRSTWSRT